MKFQHTIRLAVKIAGQIDSDRGRPLIGLAYEAAAAFTISPREIAAAVATAAGRALRGIARLARSEARAWQRDLHLIKLALIPLNLEVIYG